MLTETRLHIEEVHANPENLSFYLAKGCFDTHKLEVIKKQIIASGFGTIEMAIIGSSHYLQLGGQFVEIMTCSPEDIKQEDLHYMNQNTKDHEYRVNFDRFAYSFSVKNIPYASSDDFMAFEQSLISRKGIFAHEFYANSAITALEYDNLDDKFSFRSWHTYPQYKKVIYSETTLTRV